MPPVSSILLVEDSHADIAATRQALQAAGVCNPLTIVQDGEAAIDYLRGTRLQGNRTRYALPAVVFLDLSLPSVSAHEVLQWARSRTDLSRLPIVVLTSSSEPPDLRTSYQLGANSYMVEPVTPLQVLGLARAFNWFTLRETRETERRVLGEQATP
jgi:CheY-like chemotaxis protein